MFEMRSLYPHFSTYGHPISTFSKHILYVSPTNVYIENINNYRDKILCGCTNLIIHYNG